MQTLTKVVALSLVLMVSSCGGGGSSGGDEPTAARGLYIGTTDTGRAIRTVILPDGTYWAIYSSVADDEVFTGALNGQGSTAGTSFSSTNGYDFNAEGMGRMPFTLQANFTEMDSFSGVVDYSGLPSDMAISGTYDESIELSPSLATIAGSYTGTAAINAIASASFTISSTGTISGFGQHENCLLTGTIKPRSDANLYDVKVNFNGAECSNGPENYSGIAIYDAVAHRLLIAASNSARHGWVIFAVTSST